MEEKPLSYLIDSLLPEYIKKDYPIYIEFITKYLEMLETESGPFKVLNEINKYIDMVKITTHNIEISVESSFHAQHSVPGENHYFFIF